MGLNNRQVCYNNHLYHSETRLCLCGRLKACSTQITSPGLLRRAAGGNTGSCKPDSEGRGLDPPYQGRWGADAVYFCPVFSSDRHGYDTGTTAPWTAAWGTNGDFQAVCAALHGNGIRVVLDRGVQPRGRGFWAFQDVLKNREASPTGTGSSTCGSAATTATTTA